MIIVSIFDFFLIVCNVKTSHLLVHFRPVGLDIAAGEQILCAGIQLGAAELGLLATVGVTQVKCYKLPIVGVMSTGNEVATLTVYLECFAHILISFILY